MPTARPNWFTSVMGTAIVAVLAVRLPGHPPAAAGDLAVAFWLLSGAMLAVLTVLSARALAGGALRRWTHDPHAAPFLGTSAMGFVTVAAATLGSGPQVLGARAAQTLAWLLWAMACVLALAVSVGVPRLARHRPELRADPGHPTWILVAVPPLTIATAGTGLLPHLPSGLAQRAFAAALLALLLFGIVGTVRVLRTVARGLRRERGTARGEPTLWLILGPCGQVSAGSVLLALAVRPLLPAGAGEAAVDVARVVGLAALGAGLLWLAFVLVHTARRALFGGGLPFSLGWWAFTFPVATCAFGAIELHAMGGAGVPAGLGVTLFLGLLAGWVLAAGGTVRHALRLAAPREMAADAG